MTPWEGLRPWVGSALLAVSGFMLLGFFRADLSASVAVQLATLVVAVGIPGGAGVALLAQHVRAGTRRAGRRAHLIRQTQEAELLRLAGAHGGRLTVVEVVRELATTHPEAEGLLRSLVERGVADIEVTDQGLLVYAFPDVQMLDDKSTSRGVLDD